MSPKFKHANNIVNLVKENNCLYYMTNLLQTSTVNQIINSKTKQLLNNGLPFGTRDLVKIKLSQLYKILT
jgi:hypothetical protein